MPKTSPAKSSKQRATAPVATIKYQRPPKGPRNFTHSQIKKWVNKVFKDRAMTDA